MPTSALAKGLSDISFCENDAALAPTPSRFFSRKAIALGLPQINVEGKSAIALLLPQINVPEKSDKVDCCSQFHS
jgi:hypothetical protein